MQWERDIFKVSSLYHDFKTLGFNIRMPALVGYPLNGKIQLLSGTHRHLAAQQAGILLPVTIWLRSDIESLWGTEEWTRVIEDIPVTELMARMVEDGFKIPPYQRINTEELYESQTTDQATTGSRS
jgi:hypothetical protein